MFNISQQLVLVYYSWHYFYTDFFPVSALHGPSCGLDRIRIVNILRIESIIKYFFFNIKNITFVEGNVLSKYAKFRLHPPYGF